MRFRKCSFFRLKKNDPAAAALSQQLARLLMFGYRTVTARDICATMDLACAFGGAVGTDQLIAR
ncbi:MAG: hypothetical protein WC284_17900 [Candidimonas sp.]